jgi:hypothetical protein
VYTNPEEISGGTSELLPLIELIYSAVDDASLWPVVLDRVAEQYKAPAFPIQLQCRAEWIRWSASRRTSWSVISRKMIRSNRGRRLRSSSGGSPRTDPALSVL